MKKVIFILLVLSLPLSCFGQHYSTSRAAIYEKDMFGDLKYERDGFKATLSKNIFDDITYEDSNKNKLVYKKKFLNKLEPEGDHAILGDLIRYFRGKTGLKEEFEVDIFDTLKYSNNQGFRASLSKNIFEDVIYEDSNRNKIAFKKKFLDIFYLPELTQLDAYLFMDMFYSLQNEKDYVEEYEIDIFDNVKYTSSEGTSIKVDKETALKMFNKKKRRNTPIWRGLFLGYEDSNYNHRR